MPDASQLVWLFFKLTGRVGRAAYFLAAMLLIIAQALPLYRYMLVPEESSEAQMWAAVFGIAFLTALWCNVALAVKRLHDFGKSGLFALALFVPLVSIVAFLIFCLLPGEPNPNRYGDRTDGPAPGR